MLSFENTKNVYLLKLGNMVERTQDNSNANSMAATMVMLAPIKTGAEETSQDCRRSKKTVSSDSEYSGLAQTSLSLRDELKIKELCDDAFGRLTPLNIDPFGPTR